MKNTSLLVVAALSLFIFSCTPDKKDDPISPSSDERDVFVGSWMCSENSKITGTTSYPVSISKSTSNSSDITINRFYDITNQNVRATVSGNAIVIPYQQLNVVSGFVKGSGSMASSKTSMSLAYTTTVSANQDTCTAVYTKQ
jgi:hypothetical protein